MLFINSRAGLWEIMTNLDWNSGQMKMDITGENMARNRSMEPISQGTPFP